MDAVALYIAKDIVPIYTVEKPGFIPLLKTLDARYALPNRKYFAEVALPHLYNCTRERIAREQGPHVQRVRMQRKVAYTLFHVNDQMYQERNVRGNVRCLTPTSGLSYALFYS